MEKKTKTEKWKLAFETAQALLTCGTILVGGWWFFWQKQGEAKAICSHKLSMVMVNNGGTNFWWGCLEVKVSNVGQVPLCLGQGILKVSQINPLPDDWDLTSDKDSRIQWPQLTYNDKRFEIPILPGEEDFKNFEFTFPTNVESFRVYSYVSLGKHRPLGWSKVSTYEIKGGKVVPAEIKSE